MKIQVDRFEYGTTYTIGRLYINGALLGFTLEDKMREVAGRPVAEWKKQNETAIPCGVYPVIIDYSNHFKKSMLHILNVLGFAGVRFHGGNKPEDTEGCIVCAKTWLGKGEIYNCQQVMVYLYRSVEEALVRGEKVEVTVRNI
jgi:hypothetical protein